MAIVIQEALSLNAIIWIHSLPANDLGPTRRILDDLHSLNLVGGLPVREYAVSNRLELFALLEALAVEAGQGLRPVLHIDAHGNDEAGIALAPTDEWASWPEVMAALRKLNVATGNNLVVIFALCFGLHLYKLTDVSEATPAYLFIASEKEVSVGFLESETHAFYRQVHETGELRGAFESTLSKQMDMMNCQGLFLKVLAHYVRNYCQGPARTGRIRRMMKALVERDGLVDPKPHELGQLRRRVRVHFEPGQKLIDHFAPKFLCGRKAGFSYAEVRRLVKGQ